MSFVLIFWELGKEVPSSRKKRAKYFYFNSLGYSYIFDKTATSENDIVEFVCVIEMEEVYNKLHHETSSKV